jgi:hypothetical protein
MQKQKQNQKKVQNKVNNPVIDKFSDKYSDNSKDSYNSLLDHSNKIYETLNNEKQSMKNNVKSDIFNYKRIIIGFMILLTFVYGPSMENNEYIKNILFSNDEIINNIVKVVCL